MPENPRVRSFFAIAVGDEARRELARATETLRRAPWGDRVRWVPDGNLHVTLRFLGDVESDRLEGLLDAVQAAAAMAPASTCRLAGLAGFPSKSRPRVLVASLAPEDSLAALQQVVERAVEGQGFDAEPRRFRPHVTLGRVRRPPLRGLIDLPDLRDVTVPIERVVLFRSDLGPGGARHTSLGEAPLAGRPADSRS